MLHAHKRNQTPVELSSPCLLPAALFNTHTLLLSPLPPLLSIGMDAASNSQVFPDDPQPHGHHRPLSLATSLSPTLVNDAHNTERPSLKLRMPCGASNILNSAVINAAGQSLYSMLSNSKRTKLVSYRDNVEVATIQWNRHSSRMVFHRNLKKMKCKEWLKLAGPGDNEYMRLSPIM